MLNLDIHEKIPKIRYNTQMKNRGLLEKDQGNHVIFTFAITTGIRGYIAITKS